jgi:hypothetical protein
MLDEKHPQSSPCIIIITFSIALYRCLFFHKFSSMSRSDHIENNSFHVWRMKLSFHQVFIHPQRTPIEWVMPVLLRRCNLSKADFKLHIAQCFCHISLYGSSNSSILDALEPEHDGASDFQLFLPWTCLTRCRMDLLGPTTSMGAGTDYSVGPWDYPACATRHLMAWSTRTTEKYSVRKLYMSRTVWKTPRRTRLVHSPYSDL